MKHRCIRCLNEWKCGFSGFWSFMCLNGGDYEVDGCANCCDSNEWGLVQLAKSEWRSNKK